MVLLLAAVTASAVFVAPRAPAAPLVANGFFDFTNRVPARFSTTASLRYDDRNLYITFDCEQSGTPITATQRVEHAGVGSDDHVGFAIDTSGQGSRTYTFRVNPLGVHDESSSENARYAPPWQSQARTDAAGNYHVRMTIPLADIRAQGGAQRWRFNFERFVAAANADQTWAYAPQMQSIGSVQYWPWLSVQLSGSATRPRPQADVYLLGSAGSQHDIYQNGVGDFTAMRTRFTGIDVTYPFTNTLAFVGTLNPDFSNVEEDQTTIQLQEFQRAYQEYRPFFAQGAQYINAVPQIGVFGSGTLFYTPSIGVFDRGLKIEGTQGNSAIGALNVVAPGIDDNALGYAYTTDGGALQFSTEDILANHTGVRDETDSFGVARLNRRSGEFTQGEFAIESDDVTGAAHDFNFEEGLQNQHFTLESFYRDTTPAYGPIDGYTPTSDARGPGARVGYGGTGGATGPLLSYNITWGADRYLARDGSVREADINAFYNVQFKDLISLQGFFGPSELQVAPGVIDWFNRRQIQIGYKAGTPEPLTVGYTWGPFAGFYVQQTQLSYARVFGRYDASVEYDGNLERHAAGSPIYDSQWLRRLTLSHSFGSDASFGVALRNVNGTGGFASPGLNLSALYQQRFASQDLLYVEFGTPAATRTLHRFIVKYVFHAGGASGT
jgi:hypothetical protein